MEIQILSINKRNQCLHVDGIISVFLFQFYNRQEEKIDKSQKKGKEKQ